MAEYLMLDAGGTTQMKFLLVYAAYFKLQFYFLSCFLDL
jgi:hypothetical protein